MTEKKLDIVQFIEKNPISRLSLNYQNKLLNKIKDKFFEKEQQLFVSSFYCYLNYNSKTDFIIDLDNIWKWIGFSRKDHAKVALKKNFIENIDYKILLPQPRKQNENEHGGNNKEQILININTFKKFCLKAGTKKADEIHDYYIKLEEILHETINEETEELRNQLSIKDKEIVNINQNFKQQEKINKENILIEKLKSKNCVYIGEIEENKFIKIGSSKNINARKKQLKKLFGNFIFLDIFECDNYREIEENILNDNTIKKYLYNGKINNHQSEEVVKLEEKFNFGQLMSIVNKYINQIHFLTPIQLLEKQKLDLEKDKLEYNLLTNIINNNQYSDIIKNIIDDKLPSILNNISINIQNKQTNIKQSIINNNDNNDNDDNDVNDDDDDNDNDNINDDNDDNVDNVDNDDDNIVKRTPKGRKIQKIDPKNLKNVIKVYDSMIYLLRSPENKGFIKNCLQKSIKKNTIYKGFRWNFVENGLDPMICNIAPTKSKIKSFNDNVIIELNDTKTEIINSYATKNKIEEKLKISSKTLKKIIEDNLLYDNKYYIEYNKCPQELLNKYNKPIETYDNKKNIKIKRIDPITKDCIIFNSLTEIQKNFGITNRTIRNAIKNKTICNCFLWDYV
jgi:hypothetical protein